MFLGMTNFCIDSWLTFHLFPTNKNNSTKVGTMN